MTFQKKLSVIGLVLIVILSANTHALDDYTPVGELSGSLTIMGSGTVGKAAEYWVKEFQTIYPNVSINLTQQGSGDGAKAVLAGSADIGNMSRSMKKKEKTAFEEKYGYKPTAIRVGIDAIAVVVNPKNELSKMTLAQVDSVFSSTNKCGGNAVKTWADLGVSGAVASQEPNLKIRNPESGTRAFFKKKALCKGDFRGGEEFSHAEKLIAKVSSNTNAAGFSGLGSITDSVKPVALAKKDGGQYYSPTKENAASGKYPLSRYLFMYVNKVPGKALSPNLAEFLKFVNSSQGQNLVEKAGYVSINSKTRDANLKAMSR